jgi:hypothetical protein
MMHDLTLKQNMYVIRLNDPSTIPLYRVVLTGCYVLVERDRVY